MGEFALRTRTLGNEDQRWIGNGGDPVVEPRSIVLDRSAFDLVSDFPNGVIPSGLGLAKITATGKYGPYKVDTTAAVNGVVKITVATSGNTTVGYQGVTAAATALTADSAGATALAGLLNGLPDIDPGDFDITVGTSGDAGKLILTATSGGNWGGRPLGTFTATGTGASATQTTAGATPVAGASNGEQTLAGHLFASVEYHVNFTGDLSGALFTDGVVLETHLPVAIDAAGKADVDGHITYLTDTAVSNS